MPSWTWSWARAATWASISSVTRVSIQIATTLAETMATRAPMAVRRARGELKQTRLKVRANIGEAMVAAPRGGVTKRGQQKARRCCDGLLSSGEWIRTTDLRVMSPTSYHCSTPRRSGKYTKKARRRATDFPGGG